MLSSLANQGCTASLANRRFAAERSSAYKPLAHKSKAFVLRTTFVLQTPCTACKSSICKPLVHTVNSTRRLHSFAVLANLRLLSKAEQAYKTKGFVSVGFVRRPYKIEDFVGVQNRSFCKGFCKGLLSEAKQAAKQGVGFVSNLWSNTKSKTNFGSCKYSKQKSWWVQLSNFNRAEVRVKSGGDSANSCKFSFFRPYGPLQNLRLQNQRFCTLAQLC